jgi:hypothetical protein
MVMNKGNTYFSFSFYEHENAKASTNVSFLIRNGENLPDWNVSIRIENRTFGPKSIDIPRYGLYAEVARI